MFVIIHKELKLFFSTATGYIVIGLFLLINALFLWFIPGAYNILDNGYASVDALFVIAPWLFLFLIPAIFMKSLSEERQNNTWEILSSKAIKERNIVLGKYFAGSIVSFIALLPAIVHFISVYFIAQPVGNVDLGQFLGAYIALVFLAAVYGSIAIFASSLTQNQVVAFVLGAVTIFFLLYGFDLLADFSTSGITALRIEKLGLNSHYRSMSRGVLDSRDIIYFLSIIIIFLIATIYRVKHYYKQ